MPHHIKAISATSTATGTPAAVIYCMHQCKMVYEMLISSDCCTITIHSNLSIPGSLYDGAKDCELTEKMVLKSVVVLRHGRAQL